MTRLDCEGWICSLRRGHTVNYMECTQAVMTTGNLSFYFPLTPDCQVKFGNQHINPLLKVQVFPYCHMWT